MTKYVEWIYLKSYRFSLISENVQPRKAIQQT